MVSTTSREPSRIKAKHTHLDSLFSHLFHMSGAIVSSNSTGIDTKPWRHTSQVIQQIRENVVVSLFSV